MRFFPRWFRVNTETITSIDHQLSVLRKIMMDSVPGSERHSIAKKRIDKLLEERFEMAYAMEGGDNERTGD